MPSPLTQEVGQPQSHLHLTVIGGPSTSSELDGEVDVAKFRDAPTDPSNARFVGYTAQRLDKTGDAAVDRLLGPDDLPGDG